MKKGQNESRVSFNGLIRRSSASALINMKNFRDCTELIAPFRNYSGEMRAKLGVNIGCNFI